MTQLTIIIPAFNEEKVIASTLKNLDKTLKKENIKADLIVVNDGSSDETELLALKYADYVLTHKRNCGLGAALATGIEFAKRNNYKYLITFDSDGQHDPKDIPKTLEALKIGYDVVIGSRFKGRHSNMPISRRLVLSLSNLITLLLFGVWTSDSQSGFRGLSKSAIDVIRLKTNRMEVSSEFFGEIKDNKLTFTEVPIHIRYTKYSLLKGQKNTQGFNVLLKLIYRFFR